MSELKAALEVRVGTSHKQMLEAIRDRFEPTPAVLREAVDLAADADDLTATGATWVLRAWVENGAAFGPRLVQRLANRLGKIGCHWAQLHVCQTMRSLRVPAAQAPKFAAFFLAGLSAKRPLVRGWAMDGLFRLACEHDEYEPAASAALQQALGDRAGSVRARARLILDGGR